MIKLLRRHRFGQAGGGFGGFEVEAGVGINQAVCEQMAKKAAPHAEFACQAARLATLGAEFFQHCHQLQPCERVADVLLGQKGLQLLQITPVGRQRMRRLACLGAAV